MSPKKRSLVQKRHFLSVIFICDLGWCLPDVTLQPLCHTAAMKALEQGTPITEISDLPKHKNTVICLDRMEGSGEQVSAKLGERYN